MSWELRGKGNQHAFGVVKSAALTRAPITSATNFNANHEPANPTKTAARNQLQRKPQVSAFKNYG